MVENPARNGRETNEILEAMARAHFTRRQFQVLSLILRQTHGYRKAEGRVRLKQWSEKTGLPAPHLCNALADLARFHVISRNGNGSYILNLPQQWAAEVWQPRRSPRRAGVTGSGNGRSDTLTGGSNKDQLPPAVMEVTDSGNCGYRQWQHPDSPCKGNIKDKVKDTNPEELRSSGQTSSVSSPPREKGKDSLTDSRVRREFIAAARNKPAALGRCLVALFPDAGLLPPGGGAKCPYIGRLGRMAQAHGWGRVFSEMEYARVDVDLGKAAAGDILSWIEGRLRNGKRRGFRADLGSAEKSEPGRKSWEGWECIDGSIIDDEDGDEDVHHMRPGVPGGA